jgi:hypothetical protein
MVPGSQYSCVTRLSVRGLLLRLPAALQHALMYSGFAVSGVVELIGYVTPLPPGTEQVGVKMFKTH